MAVFDVMFQDTGDILFQEVYPQSLDVIYNKLLSPESLSFTIAAQTTVVDDVQTYYEYAASIWAASTALSDKANYLESLAFTIATITSILDTFTAVESLSFTIAASTSLSDVKKYTESQLLTHIAVTVSISLGLRIELPVILNSYFHTTRELTSTISTSTSLTSTVNVTKPLESEVLFEIGKDSYLPGMAANA